MLCAICSPTYRHVISSINADGGYISTSTRPNVRNAVLQYSPNKQGLISMYNNTINPILLSDHINQFVLVQIVQKLEGVATTDENSLKRLDLFISEKGNLQRT